jgi:hypothetical protein
MGRIVTVYVFTIYMIVLKNTKKRRRIYIQFYCWISHKYSNEHLQPPYASWPSVLERVAFIISISLFFTRVVAAKCDGAMYLFFQFCWHTSFFVCRHHQKISRLKSGDLGGHLYGLPWLIHRPGKAMVEIRFQCSPKWGSPQTLRTRSFVFLKVLVCLPKGAALNSAETIDTR